MKLFSILVTLVAGLAFSSLALAVDVYPEQPNVQGAYNKLVAALAQLDKAKLEPQGEHVKNAIVEIDSAKTFLEQATNNKGTYLHTAKDLCEQAKTALEATTPDLDKGTDLCNRALHEVNMAGKAGRRKH
jgi:hypothetical protein